MCAPDERKYNDYAMFSYWTRMFYKRLATQFEFDFDWIGCSRLRHLQSNQTVNSTVSAIEC